MSTGRGKDKTLPCTWDGGCNISPDDPWRTVSVTLQDMLSSQCYYMDLTEGSFLAEK